jgi:cyclophilin family peptidyl-prolyl cis-trans isomerase
MDLSVDGKPCGTVDFGLFGKVAPKNINNFLHLLIRGYIMVKVLEN